MPRWLARVLWACRGKRFVRLHCVTPGETPKDVTFEGFLVGRWSGVYILARPKVLEADDTTITLDSTSAEIPAERVFFVEVLAKDGRS